MSEPTKAVFLSYASQDAAAVERIAEALRASGVEVWFDKNELVGGDAWDQKIRRQIKECALFVPVISANTNARAEGYFRLEWKLAVDRSHLLADDHPFLFPVVIDDTSDSAARVPDKFREVQWTRLNVKDTPDSLARRVAKILGGGIDVGPVADRAPGQRRGPPSSQPGKKFWAWFGYAWGLVGMIIGLSFMFRDLWPWRSREAKPAAEKSAASRALTPTATAAPQSEARQLAEKARTLFDALQGTRDDYHLAEELMAQAKARDAADAEVCAAEAQLHERFITRLWDTSDARREAARAAVLRAMRLDPQSFEARWAQAGLLNYTGREGEERTRQLRELRRERPKDKRILRALATGLERMGHLEEAVAIFDESAALPGGDPLALYSKSHTYWFAGRTAEAESAIEAAIAQQPFTGALLMNVWYKTILHGDLDGARALLDRINPAELIEDRAAYFGFIVEWLAHRPDAAMARLAAVPRDWLNDSWYRGPKGLLVGDAHQLAGRPDAAAIERRGALQLVEQRLATDPNNFKLHYNRLELLAKLGQGAEAERQFAVLLQMSGANLAEAASAPAWLSSACTLLGRKADAIRLISAGLKRGTHAVEFTATDLRLNPDWNPLRSEPEFAAVIAEAERIEKAAALPGGGGGGAALVPSPGAKSVVVSAVSEKSLVVLPLENLSPDPENAFFTDGLHTEIISALQGIADLKVIGRDTSLTLKRGSAPVAELASRVGVANVITGSVRRAGNTVRIQLELRRASDEALLWSLPKGDRELKDVLGLQSEVADEVARVLQARTERGSSAGARFLAAEPRVYDLFLKAYGIYRANNADRARVAECVAMMDEALRLDPKFMPAARLAGRMGARLFLLTNDPDEQVRCAQEARKWSELAARLMPGGAGDGALAYYYCFVENDDARALTYAENSIRALPNDVEGYHVAALALLGMGRLEEAAKKWEQTEALDTGSVPSWGFHIRALSQLRRKAACEELLAQFQRVSDGARIRNVNEGSTLLARFTLDGTLPTAADQIFSATERADWLWRGRRFAELLSLSEAQPGSEPTARFRWLRRKSDALLRLNRTDEAAATAREALTIAQALQSRSKVGLPVNDGRLAGALARLGQADEAIARGRSHVEAVPAVSLGTRWSREIELAGLYALLNRPRECVELLAKLLRVPSGLTVPMLKVDPAWDNVREDAAFEALLTDPKNSAPL